MNGSFGLIILAAGGSSRMGSPKQLLQYRGKTLLRRAVDVGIECGCAPIVVVVGHDAPRMYTELEGLPVVITENPDWKHGMGSSIRSGIITAEDAAPDLAAVIVMLCDQPLVDSSVMRRLIAGYENGGYPIAAASYAEALGVPAIFNRNYFHVLRNLPVNTGASRRWKNTQCR